MGAQQQRLSIPDPRAPIALSEIEDMLEHLLGLGDTGAARAVDLIVCQAIHHTASDLHMEPWEESLSLRFRLDGVLHEVAMLPKKYHDKIVARAKVLANMIIYQKELPQDGRIEANDVRLGRPLRISTFPTIHGEKLVVRIIDARQDLMRTDALGFRRDVTDGLRNIVFKPQGTLLLTGPSSSGKTTTIYSLLRELMAQQASTRHIVTIEDPVESQLPRISQTQINPSLDFTFQSAFRALLRQDPDVIMVGEIRDSDTANTAVQAGLTGHLVISTIHSGTACGVFTRLLDMGVQPYLAASSVNGVLAQRLMRANCPHCAKPYKPDALLVKAYGLTSRGAKFRRGLGCAQCRGIGYRGRTAIGELLTLNDEFAELVMTRARTRTLNEAALRLGMVPLIEDGLDRATQGETTLEELRFVIPPPEDHERTSKPKRPARKKPAAKKKAASKKR